MQVQCSMSKKRKPIDQEGGGSSDCPMHCVSTPQIQSPFIYGCQSNSATLHHDSRDNPPSHSKHFTPDNEHKTKFLCNVYKQKSSYEL